MKTLLAILLSFIVSEAPVFAIHGGYSLSGASSVTGSYAGVLIPTGSTALTTGTVAAGTPDFGSNSLGLFTLGIPQTGVGSGALVIFSGAASAVGSIAALPDPKSTGSIIGILTATASETLFSGTDGVFGTFNESVVIAQANGALKASVSNTTVTNSPTGVNINGTATVTFASGNGTDAFGNPTPLVPTEEVDFEVDGFQQSAFAAASGAAL